MEGNILEIVETISNKISGEDISMPKIKYDEENTIFALDIGTRTVIGLVGLVQEGSIKVLHQAMVEHQSRAMLDGQIHDIPKVASAVEKVIAGLEKKLKYKVKRVAIAAAGRSLKTIKCRVDQEIPDAVEIEPLMINTLELTGVQMAQRILEQEAEQRIVKISIV
nr:cell division protein FtsA [Desulforamulus aquiferis]